MSGLAIDIGQSGIRASWSGAIASSPTGMHPLTDRARLDSLVRQVRLLAERLGARPRGVGVGLSGFVEGSVAPSDLGSALVDAFDASYVAVAADAVTAFLGTIGPNAGTVAICGTGVAVLGFDGAHGWRRVDARGYLLGDFGSGFWIGQKGLQAALDAYEGRGPATLLAKAARRLGPIAEIYEASMASGGAPRYLAAFAPDVFEAALADDAVANEIIADAAHEIVRSIVAARLGDGGIGLTGGLVRSPRFIEAMSRALAEAGIEHRPVTQPDAALVGAHILADRPKETLAAFAGLVVLEESP